LIGSIITGFFGPTIYKLKNSLSICDKISKNNLALKTISMSSPSFSISLIT
jgi:hypothetical protein